MTERISSSSFPTPVIYREGTYRARTPQETLNWLRPHLGTFGITRLADITGLDRIGIPVATACRPNSRSLATSQGKGHTLEAAKASALMESIELYHGEHITIPLLYGDWRSLSRYHVLVDPNTLPLVQGSRFSPELEILWIEGRCLCSDERVLVPYETVHTSARVPAPPGSGCFLSTSNGLSGGNHIWEACLHGICEAIERDSTALWELRDEDCKRASRINLSTVDDQLCRWVIDRLEAAGMDLAVWETTSDVGVPSFLCQIIDRRSSSMRLVDSFTGMGCHTSRDIAFLRATTEAAQCRLTLIAGSRDDLFRREYGNVRRGRAIPSLYGKLHNFKDNARSFSDVPSTYGANFEECLKWVINRLAEVGLSRIIVVDLTMPEFQIPVARIIVPGLEGPDDDPEYTPGPRAQQAKGRR